MCDHKPSLFIHTLSQINGADIWQYRFRSANTNLHFSHLAPRWIYMQLSFISVSIVKTVLHLPNEVVSHFHECKKPETKTWHLTLAISLFQMTWTVIWKGTSGVTYPKERFVLTFKAKQNLSLTIKPFFSIWYTRTSKDMARLWKVCHLYHCISKMSITCV